MKQLPLFPLSVVLFPGGRMPLQIFEPRYLDLVRDCLKHGTEFGVVWIREGHEVVSVPNAALPGANTTMPQANVTMPNANATMPKLAQLGTIARIVDWDALPNGRLGVLIEGATKFRLLSTTQQTDFLVIGAIEPLPMEAPVALPERANDLLQLLEQLMRHPSIAQLNLAREPMDSGRVTHLIAQLLPIPEAAKFSLLAELDPLLRIDRLLALLDGFND